LDVEHQAKASAVTVDNRTDAVLVAYGLASENSSFDAGSAIDSNLNASVQGVSKAQSVQTIADADGAASMQLNVQANSSQYVDSSNVSGVGKAGLASRTFGINDNNVSDSSPDSIEAGAGLILNIAATADLSSLARNVGAAAVAATGLTSICLQNVPITAGENANVNTSVFALGNANALSTGDQALLDRCIPNLQLDGIAMRMRLVKM
jgi:hypothetical protein